MLFRYIPVLFSLAIIAAAYALHYQQTANPSHADTEKTIAVEKATLQQGFFRLPDCPSAPDALFDECECESSLIYPAIQGLRDPEVSAKLNAFFISLTEPFRCEGEPVANAPTLQNGNHHTASTSFDVTFQSDSFVGIRFNSYLYSGGAHGMPGVSAYVIDLTSGHFLTAGDLPDSSARAEANQRIYDALKAMPEEAVFPDAIEKLKGAFLTAEGCETCTIGITNGGLEVVFSVYAVAPYVSGNVVISLPASLVTHTQLREQLMATAPVSSSALHLPPAP